MNPISAIRYVHQRKVVFYEGILPTFYEDCTELGTSTESWGDPSEGEVDYGGWHELHPSRVWVDEKAEWDFISDCDRLYTVFANHCRAYRLSQWKKLDLTVWGEDELVSFIQTMNDAMKQVEWPHLRDSTTLIKFMGLMHSARFALAKLRGHEIETVPTHGYVYLIKSNTGHYKIGKSVNPQKRMKEFVSSNVILPIEFTLEHQIETDDYHRLESTLHNSFSEKRFRGEWFELTDEEVMWFKCFTVVVCHLPENPVAAA